LRFIIDRSIFFTGGAPGGIGRRSSQRIQRKGQGMIIITYGEKVVNAVWWVITSVITLYLLYGVYNTFEVITR
jgi:hypothetical protein